MKEPIVVAEVTFPIQWNDNDNDIVAPVNNVDCRITITLCLVAFMGVWR